ncbi:hypothetical protein CP09DC79_1190B, partial [Chlamydia psittaci 09DC79]
PSFRRSGLVWSGLMRF